MRKRALVSRADNDAMPSLRGLSRKHADDLSAHDGGLHPTAKRSFRPQTTAPSNILRSANPLILKGSERTNAPNAKNAG